MYNIYPYNTIYMPDNTNYTIFPLKLMMATNIPDTEPFEFTSSNLYHPNIKLMSKLEKYPLFTYSVKYPNILSQWDYSRITEFFFKKEIFKSVLMKNAGFVINFKENSDKKNEVIEYNIKFMLSLLFPITFPYKRYIEDSYNKIILNKTSLFLDFDFVYKFLYQLDNKYSYIKHNGKVMTITNAIFVNDVFNHPKYKKLIEEYDSLNKVIANKTSDLEKKNDEETNKLSGYFQELFHRYFKNFVYDFIPDITNTGDDAKKTNNGEKHFVSKIEINIRNYIINVKRSRMDLSDKTKVNNIMIFLDYFSKYMLRGINSYKIEGIEKIIKILEQIKKLEEDKKKLEEQISKLKEEITKLNEEKLKEKLKEKTKLEEKIKEIEEKIKKLEEDIKKLGEDIKKLGEDIKKLEGIKEDKKKPEEDKKKPEEDKKKPEEDKKKPKIEEVNKIEKIKEICLTELKNYTRDGNEYKDITDLADVTDIINEFENYYTIIDVYETFKNIFGDDTFFDIFKNIMKIIIKYKLSSKINEFFHDHDKIKIPMNYTTLDDMTIKEIKDFLPEYTEFVKSFDNYTKKYRNIQDNTEFQELFDTKDIGYMNELTEVFQCINDIKKSNKETPDCIEIEKKYDYNVGLSQITENNKPFYEIYIMIDVIEGEINDSNASMIKCNFKDYDLGGIFYYLTFGVKNMEKHTLNIPYLRIYKTLEELMPKNTKPPHKNINKKEKIGGVKPKIKWNTKRRLQKLKRKTLRK